MMLAIFPPVEFGPAVDAVCEALELPVRLGGRVVELGAHAGKLFVDCALFDSCPEWRGLISQSVSGGTAHTEAGLIVEAGRTIQVTDPLGTPWGPYEIIAIENPAALFNPPPEFP